jgi:hypothetical protein
VKSCNVWGDLTATSLSSNKHQVIELIKIDLGELIKTYERDSMPSEETETNSDDKTNKDERAVPEKPKKLKSLQVQKKEIAVTFQYYLILSFFACVPDRQRTFRELELGRNFLRVETAQQTSEGGDDDEAINNDIWIIKHTADDYKTGSTYGERPPLPLLPSLTPSIDDFLERWRPALTSKENPSAFLFLQPRTGNPLTANSVYQIVSRSCYNYKQKKTNPHLLRDMIVTHVRKNADASEKELEALALFMGHSIKMQRESYDRRTLDQKVQPAIQLMQSVNSLGKE